MKYELETMREIWNDSGECYEVGPDRDKLNCIEIRFKNKEGKICDRIMFEPEAARLVAKALLDGADEMDNYLQKKE